MRMRTVIFDLPDIVDDPLEDFIVMHDFMVLNQMRLIVVLQREFPAWDIQEPVVWELFFVKQELQKLLRGETIETLKYNKNLTVSEIILLLE